MFVDLRARELILDGGVYTVLVPTVDLRDGTFHPAICAIDSS